MTMSVSGASDLRSQIAMSDNGGHAYGQSRKTPIAVQPRSNCFIALRAMRKASADGIDDSLAVFGRPPLEAIAHGFGLRGQEIRDVSAIPKLFANFVAQGESELWNIQISDQVIAPVIRQTIKRGHGNM